MRYNRYWNKNGCIVETDHTWQLGTFAQELTYEAIPEDAAQKAKKILISTLGAAIAASDMPVVRSALSLAESANGGEGGATTVWGSGKKLSAINNGLYAGTVCHALDWDDNSWTGHPSSAIVPAAWLTAEEKHSSGKELLTAITAAYEVYQRIAMAVQPTEEAWKEKGWGQMSWQIFGAAIASAKLCSFDARKFDQTIGLCCESSPLGTDFPVKTGSDFHFYEYGYRVRDALMVVKAVEKGVWNSRDTLDEGACYFGVICDTPDTDWFTKDLGKKYLINETAVRRWPASLWMQSALDAIYQIITKYDISVNDVEEITVSPAVRELWTGEKGGLLKKQYSAARTVAAMLLSEKPGADWYLNCDEEKIDALAAKIHCGGEEETDIPAMYTAFRQGNLPHVTVQLRTADARCFTLVKAGFSEPDLDEVLDTFKGQCASVFGEEKAEKITSMLSDIENAEDIAEIAGIF